MRLFAPFCTAGLAAVRDRCDNAAMLEPLLTDADIARALRTTPRNVKRLARLAGLPHVAIPAVGMRFVGTAVESWIRDQQQPKAEAR